VLQFIVQILIDVCVTEAHCTGV